MRFVFILSLMLLALLAGCGSPLPSAIAKAPADPVTLGQVRGHPDPHIGKQVRWGGTILKVENKTDHTDVLVLGRTLSRNGEPPEEGAVEGRFIARFSGFVDPAQLPEGRKLTVRGSVLGVEIHKVGDYPYRYPVVEVTAWHLWPTPEPLPYYYRDPWWPYFGYPWYPYPYGW